MARPRVFLSSTFYDLRHLRAELEQFIRSLGYEPVLHERGAVAYGSDERLEQYAYKEVELSDLLVSIIGGRFGTESQVAPYSISQVELKTALELGKQVFIFIEQAVATEYRTYLANKSSAEIKYNFVDDARVYAFIEEIESLPHNNPIMTFETGRDITSHLRDQWAGLFQRSLQEKALLKQVLLFQNIQETAGTLNRLVSFLTEERRNRDEAIKSILLMSHPAFAEIKKVLHIPYRVFFTTSDELDKLINARAGWRTMAQDDWDSPDFAEWGRDLKEGDLEILKVSTRIFDDGGRLRVYTDEEWEAEWIDVTIWNRDRDFAPSSSDDDIPF